MVITEGNRSWTARKPLDAHSGPPFLQPVIGASATPAGRVAWGKNYRAAPRPSIRRVTYVSDAGCEKPGARLRGSRRSLLKGLGQRHQDRSREDVADEVGVVTEVQLVHDARAVGFRRATADRQTVGDADAAVALGHEHEDFALAARQRLVGVA